MTQPKDSRHMITRMLFFTSQTSWTNNIGGMEHSKCGSQLRVIHNAKRKHMTAINCVKSSIKFSLTFYNIYIN